MEPDPIDVYVGKLLLALRKSRGVNQTELGEAIGVQFQQVQKYETGANRISASKLYKAAMFLGVEPNYFFEGYRGREFSNYAVTALQKENDRLRAALIDIENAAKSAVKKKR